VNVVGVRFGATYPENVYHNIPDFSSELMGMVNLDPLVHVAARDG
jgi:hypothetical protein